MLENSKLECGTHTELLQASPKNIAPETVIGKENLKIRGSMPEGTERSDKGIWQGLSVLPQKGGSADAKVSIAQPTSLSNISQVPFHVATV